MILLLWVVVTWRIDVSIFFTLLCSGHHCLEFGSVDWKEILTILPKTFSSSFLPIAYVVRRKGYVLTHVSPCVCPHMDGYPSQVQMGGGVPQLGLTGGGGYPSQVQAGGGYPSSGNRWSAWYAAVGMRSHRRTFLFILFCSVSKHNPSPATSSLRTKGKISWPGKLQIAHEFLWHTFQSLQKAWNGSSII